MLKLTAKFDSASLCTTVPVGELVINESYAILHAERVTTRFGPCVTLNLQRNSEAIIKIFLPRRYSSIINAEEIEMLNTQKAVLIYHGCIGDTKAFHISIKSAE